jgi:pyrophosphate--fructose-6-phosphate 1-phosphotransferase
MHQALSEKRLQYKPKIPSILADLLNIRCHPKPFKTSPLLHPFFPKTKDTPFYTLELGARAPSLPLKVGVFFSGGPAPGGHNVVAGLFDALREMNPQSELIGFKGGPQGVLADHHQLLTAIEIDSVRNQGGFDLLGTDRTKIETAEQFEACLKVAQTHKLDALIIIGGDDSNTNGALLAEFFQQQGQSISVIGVPKTIDGDLRSPDVEISFGFHTACKTYAESIGNIAKDALSAKKYYHLIKLMGRSASHVTLECALATQPNLALIGEERKSFAEIVKKAVDLILERHQKGKNYGVLLMPEGLLEFVPEIRLLLDEWNALSSDALIESSLSPAALATYRSLPASIREELRKRDPHGNLAISQVETEDLFIQLVKEELQRRQFRGSWHVQTHFLGYEGRSALPTNFDANYAYCLGRLAAVGVRERITGVLAAISALKGPAKNWIPKFIPLTSLMHLEKRKGVEKPVIQKASVDLHSAAYLRFQEKRGEWALQDVYQCPGPIQFFGTADLTDDVPITVYHS